MAQLPTLDETVSKLKANGYQADVGDALRLVNAIELLQVEVADWKTRTRNALNLVDVLLQREEKGD